MSRQPTSAGSDRMTRRQAAAYLTDFCSFPISHKTLNQYASRGHVQGPPYSLANGRAMYGRADLEAWATEHTTPTARTHAEHQDREQRAA